MVSLVLLGPPGCGKGTQAVRLQDRFDFAHLSTGDMLRDAIAKGTPLGRQAKSIMDSGGLVPDDIMIGLVTDRIDQVDCRNGFILDGFPRTEAQAGALDALLVEKDKSLTAVVMFDVNDDALVERITGRFSCATCGAGYHNKFRPTQKEGACDQCGGLEFSRRSDDTAVAVRTRLATYHAQTAPILSFYQARNLLISIDGMAEMDAVTDSVFDALTARLS